MSALTDSDLYYLRSIKRVLDELYQSIEFGPTLAGEVLADNRDWLDCFIDQHEREAAEAIGRA